MMTKFKFTSLVLLLTLIFIKGNKELFTKNTKANTDTTAPNSSISVSPTNPDGENGWYISPLDITINSDDLESGVKTIYWQLNTGEVNSQNFNNNLNLVANPSFETTGTPISNWGTVGDTATATYTQDSTAAVGMGSKSAKIISNNNSWHAFSNQAIYAVAAPYTNMTASVWIKTQNVTSGGYIKMYQIYTNGSGGTETSIIQESSKIYNTQDWQKISVSFTPNNPTTIGVFMEVGLDGTGTVWYDGASITSAITPTEVNFVESANGTHTLSYYAKDYNNNTETPAKTKSFKVDTKIPSKWVNFSLSEVSNSHTFVVALNVSDKTSGLQTSTAEFQYSTDQGVTWGYHETLTSCGSTFITNGWAAATATPGTSGILNTTLKTPPIDFCNSNWTQTKKIRFRIKDVAGNQGQSPDFTINGAWIQINNGDIFSNSSISMQANSKIANLVGAKETVSNTTSLKDWYVYNYEKLPFDTYETIYNKFNTTTSLPGGKLPITSGRYLVNSDFTVASSTIPSNLVTTTNLAAVIFVNGDLNINANYALHNTSGIIFIVKGDIDIGTSVTAIDGYYITNGTFDMGSSSNALTVNGGIQADNFIIKRSLNSGNNTQNPAEIINYDPKYIEVGRGYVASNSNVIWLGIE